MEKHVVDSNADSDEDEDEEEEHNRCTEPTNHTRHRAASYPAANANTISPEKELQI